MNVKRVSILGASGSVGMATVDLIERSPERFETIAIAGGSNASALAEAARRTMAPFVAIADPDRYADLRSAASGLDCELAAGPEAVIEAARRKADIVVAAIVGIAGLAPTLAAAETGADIALANKETLVSAGDLLPRVAAKAGGAVLPVDSEHSALFQVYETERAHALETLTLTASGGPFREWTLERMATAKVEDALAHPNWEMGAKITIDSATMMNKGLELIEAARLFPLPEDRIDILVHPQSVIHGMATYRDGSTLAQMGAPDMRTPIALALSWPDRMPTPTARLDLATLGKLTFEAPDERRFPSLRLAREALRAGGDRPAILNGANEAAVAAFLERRIGYLDIASVVEDALAATPTHDISDLEGVMTADAEARAAAETAIERARAA